MRQRKAASKQRTAAEFRLLFEKLTNTFKIFCRYRKRCYSNFVFTMKIQGLMVILLTAFVGVQCADWTDRPIEFPLELLKPDLSAFSQYYQNNLNHYFGFLQWPGSIIFRVRPVKHKFTNED